MKFRAVIRDPQYMKEFQNIAITLSKLSRECVMKISQDRLHFITNEEFGNSAPLVWIEIDIKQYFVEYSMQPSNSSHPHIFLTIGTLNLGRALAVLRNNANSCKIKLTNIQFPCLTISSDVISQSSDKSRQVVHDVPVLVVPRSDWGAYAIPIVPLSKVVLNVPSNRLIRSLIDRVKNLSPNIIFFATSNGEMNIVSETEMATITTRYKNLEVRALNPNDADKKNKSIEASCSVDCKKTAMFFSALQVPTLEWSCGIDDDRTMHIEVNVRKGIVIHSVLPAVCV